MFRIFAGFPGFEDGFRPPLVFALYVFQLFVRQVLQPHKRIVRFADANEFVQLHLNRGEVTVLRILDQEHHQKRDDGRTCVDHKLPSIREPEERVKSHKRIVRFADANEFVQLHLNRGGVTVLRILDQEHHQKRDDGRTCVDHKLPSIREPEERAGNRPDNHGTESKGKHPGSTYFAGTDLRDFSK